MKKTISGTWRRIMGCFLAGVFAILPLVITVLVVVYVVQFMAALLGPDTPLGDGLEKLGLSVAGKNSKWVAYAIGWLLVLGVIFLLGVVVELGAKRWFKAIFDGILRRLPVVGRLYDASRQLVDMMDKQGETELKGMSAVFVYFGKDSGAGVLALLPTSERFHINGRDFHIILIPTAPIPFGGGLFFVPVDSVIPADMSVEGLMSVYVSMGATTNKFLPTGKNAVE